MLALKTKTKGLDHADTAYVLSKTEAADEPFFFLVYLSRNDG